MNTCIHLYDVTEIKPCGEYRYHQLGYFDNGIWYIREIINGEPIGWARFNFMYVLPVPPERGNKVGSIMNFVYVHQIKNEEIKI